MKEANINIHDALSRLPGDIARRAIRNAERFGPMGTRSILDPVPMRNGDGEEHITKNAVFAAFCWDHTEEGPEFWKAVALAAGSDGIVGFPNVPAEDIFDRFDMMVTKVRKDTSGTLVDLNTFARRRAVEKMATALGALMDDDADSFRDVPRGPDGHDTEHVCPMCGEVECSVDECSMPLVRDAYAAMKRHII